jgi:hypothetical protein
MELHMQTQEPKPQQKRNVYRTPKLARYGIVAAVTQGGIIPAPFEIVTSFSGNPG